MNLKSTVISPDRVCMKSGHDGIASATAPDGAGHRPQGNAEPDRQPGYGVSSRRESQGCAVKIIKANSEQLGHGHRKTDTSIPSSKEEIQRPSRNRAMAIHEGAVHHRQGQEHEPSSRAPSTIMQFGSKNTVGTGNVVRLLTGFILTGP